LKNNPFEAPKPALAFPGVEINDLHSEGFFPDGTTNLVDARALAESLRVGRAFTDWIKDIIAKWGLVEGQHFMVVAHYRIPREAGGLPRGCDWHLHPLVALQIAIQHRSVRGKLNTKVDALQAELSALRACLEPLVRDWIDRFPQAKQMLALLANRSLSDEQRAQAMGWDSESWCSSVRTLESAGVLYAQNNIYDVHLS
jgi:phage anti-repressor protein